MAITKTRNPVIGETVPISVTCIKTDGSKLDLTGATIWVTLKTAPVTQADVAAALQINSVGHAAQFVIGTGVFTATLTAANTATLTAGTVYYIDVKVKDAAGAMYYVVPKQTFIFDLWVTRST